MTHYDCLVLGTGGVGSAACWQLARRGAKVLGLDRFPPGHDRGSSHGQTRIIRQAYFEHADYVPLLRRAYQLWAELEQATGQQLFQQVGLLQVGPADGVVLPGVLRAAREHDLQVESLSATESERRFPGFHVPEALAAVFEPRAGLLLVEACVQAHCAAAVAVGAELRSGVTVHDWTATAEGVRVRTDQGDFEAKNLIVTAGAWAGPLLRDALPPVRVLRKHIYWFPTSVGVPPSDGCSGEPPKGGTPTEAPSFLYELPHGVFYGLPAINSDGLKCGEHSGGLVSADPLNDPRLLDVSDQNRVVDFVRQHLRSVEPRVQNRSVCFYTRSPDEHFLLERHPEHPHVCFAAGLSGHGFKFTGVLGEVLADWTLTQTTQLPAEFLSLRRFRSG